MIQRILNIFLHIKYYLFTLIFFIFLFFVLGEASILFLLGKTHSLWSRKTYITDNTRNNHLKVATKLFDFLIRNNNLMKDINEKKGNGIVHGIPDLPQEGNTGFGGAFLILSK